MKPHRRRRLYIILGIFFSVALIVGLLLFALRQNINLYLTSSQVLSEKILPNVEFRMGGWVKEKSLHYGKGLSMTFIVTDRKGDVTVHYIGLVPTLFREGQGIVVQGKLDAQHIFQADQVLAKHDADYHPPNISQVKNAS